MIGATILGLHLLTAHAHGGYESRTPGIYFRDASCITAGAYRNSVGRLSIYAGCTLERGRFALTLGGVTGYGGGAMPLVIPSARIDLGGGFFLRAAVVPKPRRDGGSAALHFAIERHA